MVEVPDTITVTGSAATEVTASHAAVHISVTGSSSFGGDQALARAREVTAMVADLQRAGIGPDRIEVLGVATHASSGRVARSSAATYRLRVTTETTEQVPLVLDTVASQKNAGIDAVVWRYPERSGQVTALREAVAAARQTASVAAEALDVQLLQVHRFSEQTYDEEHAPMPRMMALGANAEGATALDIEVLHRKTVRVQVEISYRIG